MLQPRSDAFAVFFSFALSLFRSGNGTYMYNRRLRSDTWVFLAKQKPPRFGHVRRRMKHEGTNKSPNGRNMKRENKSSMKFIRNLDSGRVFFFDMRTDWRDCIATACRDRRPTELLVHSGQCTFYQLCCWLMRMGCFARTTFTFHIMDFTSFDLISARCPVRIRLSDANTLNTCLRRSKYRMRFTHSE